MPRKYFGRKIEIEKLVDKIIEGTKRIYENTNKRF